jgi:hypothetical protein
MRILENSSFGRSAEQGHATGHGKELSKMKYRVHRFDIRMTADQSKLEQFLNNLQGEVIAIVPNISLAAFWAHRVNFLLIVEKLS